MPRPDGRWAPRISVLEESAYTDRAQAYACPRKAPGATPRHFLVRFRIADLKVASSSLAARARESANASARDGRGALSNRVLESPHSLRDSRSMRGYVASDSDLCADLAVRHSARTHRSPSLLRPLQASLRAYETRLTRSAGRLNLVRWGCASRSEARRLAEKTSGKQGGSCTC